MATAVGTSGRAASPSRASPVAPLLHPDKDLRVVVPALAIGGVILVGMGWGIAPLATVGALAAIAASLVAPAVGLATIAFMGPLQPPLVIPSPGFNAILVGAVILGCIYRLPIDRPRIRLTAPMLPLLGFVLYVAVQQTPEMATGYAGDQGHLVAYEFGQLITGFGAVVAAAYILSQRSPFPFLAVGLASAVVAALLAIATSVNPAVGPPIAGLLAHATIDQRAVGSFYNPNYFGVFEAIAITTAAGWMLGTRSTRLRLALLATCVVLGVALMLSLSRTAMITCAAGLGFLALSRSRPRNGVVIAAGLLVGVIVLFPIFVNWRLSATFGASSADAYAELAQSDQGRLSGVLAGPQLFLSSPVFGIGWANYFAMSSRFAGVSIAAHNWYMNVLAQEGTVGIVLWLLLLVLVVIALRSRPTFPRSTGLGVLGAYAVGSLFLEAPISFQTSALPILVIVAALASDWTQRPEASRSPGGEEATAPSGAWPSGRARLARGRDHEAGGECPSAARLSCAR